MCCVLCIYLCIYVCLLVNVLCSMSFDLGFVRVGVVACASAGGKVLVIAVARLAGSMVDFGGGIDVAQPLALYSFCHFFDECQHPLLVKARAFLESRYFLHHLIDWSRHSNAGHVCVYIECHLTLMLTHLHLISSYLSLVVHMHRHIFAPKNSNFEPKSNDYCPSFLFGLSIVGGPRGCLRIRGVGLGLQGDHGGGVREGAGLRFTMLQRQPPNPDELPCTYRDMPSSGGMVLWGGFPGRGFFILFG